MQDNRSTDNSISVAIPSDHLLWFRYDVKWHDSAEQARLSSAHDDFHLGWVSWSKQEIRLG